VTRSERNRPAVSPERSRRRLRSLTLTRRRRSRPPAQIDVDVDDGSTAEYSEPGPWLSPDDAPSQTTHDKPHFHSCCVTDVNSIQRDVT